MIQIENIKVTTLVDNGVADIEYLAEWGLSLHLDIKDDTRVLFDTGDGRACVPNAVCAGVALEDTVFSSTMPERS